MKKVNVEYEKGKRGWRFKLYDDDGLDFCTSIWFESEQVCKDYSKMLTRS